MKHYPKINTLFIRDEKKKIIEGEWSMPEFDYLQDNHWYWYEKIDGANVRIIFIPGEQVIFKGKDQDTFEISNILLKGLKDKFTVESMSKIFTKPVCLYGEGYGTTVNDKGRFYSTEANFKLFDVLIDGWWLERKSIINIAEKLMVHTTKLLDSGSLIQAIKYVRDINNTSESYLEGLILRPEIDLFTRKGERIIGKLKRRDFE